jgi:tight adherence protein C
MLLVAVVMFAVGAVVLFLTLRPATAEADAVTLTPTGAMPWAPPQIEPTFFDRVVMPAVSTVSQRIYRTLPPGKIAAIRRKIVLAGRQSSWNVEKVLAAKVVGTGLGVTLALLMVAISPGVLGLIFAGLVVFMGYYSGDYVLSKAAGARQIEIQRALADVLDQITVCVEAGLGFDAAIMRCVANNQNALCDELGRTMQDVRLGMPRSQALNALLDRTDVPDLRLFIRAILQADKSGVPLARILRVQSDEVREKRRQAAEERAMKLPVLLMVPLVLCILPSLFIVIMGPAVIRVLESDNI